MTGQLLAKPPKTLRELRDDFELQERIVEQFGKQILVALQASAPHVANELTTRAKVAASREVAGGKVGAAATGVSTLSGLASTGSMRRIGVGSGGATSGGAGGNRSASLGVGSAGFGGGGGGATAAIG